MNEEISGKVATFVVRDVLVIEIRNPPINAGSLAVRQGILDALAHLNATPQLLGAVIIGGGRTFIAGSDLREFGKPLEDPQLPAVILAIEASSRPVVAALHGAALGGGFELALGCDARVADRQAVVGLPEVTLGMIPGAGGTQRLPRRAGLAKSITLICTGQRISAVEAEALRLVDQVVDADLLESAVECVHRLAGRKVRIRDEQVRVESAQEIADAERQALHKGKGRPSVVAAIESIHLAATRPIDEALAHERAVFQRFRLGNDASALRHLFFAEREACKLPSDVLATARPVQTVAVIGAGAMGTGIAICALDAKLKVLLLDREATALQAGTQRVTRHYQGRVEAGKMDAAAAAIAEGRLTPTTDWASLGDADVVIEAVFEDLDIKREVFRQIDRYARPGAVLATNTSYLDVDAIASATTRPGDVLGLHFFSPANVMKLLEVVRGTRTGSEALATGMALGLKLRKLPVLAGNAFGFIGNRIYNAYRRQCEFMLEDGTWPEDVDHALVSMGFAMGPFAVADLSGLDIAWRMRKSQAARRDPRERYVDILDQLCELGRLGRKSSAGYYTYAEGRQAKTTDATVREIILRASTQRGRTRQPLGAETIQRRALLAMVNEAALLLAEGVAARPGDIDVVMVQGYGFPRWEGGPAFWARRQDRARLDMDLDQLMAGNGFGAIRADRDMLDRLLA